MDDKPVEVPGTPKPSDEDSNPKTSNTLFPKDDREWTIDDGIVFALTDLVFLDAEIDETTSRKILTFRIPEAIIKVKEYEWVEYVQRVFDMALSFSTEEGEFIDACMPLSFLVEEAKGDRLPIYSITELIEGLDFAEII